MTTPEVGKVQTSVWLSGEDLRRADALVRKVAKNPVIASTGRVNRSAVLRLALTRGLEVLEKEYR